MSEPPRKQTFRDVCLSLLFILCSVIFGERVLPRCVLAQLAQRDQPVIAQGWSWEAFLRLWPGFGWRWDICVFAWVEALCLSGEVHTGPKYFHWRIVSKRGAVFSEQRSSKFQCKFYEVWAALLIPSANRAHLLVLFRKKTVKVGQQVHQTLCKSVKGKGSCSKNDVQ